MAIDQTRIDGFVGKMVGDLAASCTSALVLIGDKLGLYRCIADAGPVTSAEVAERTGTTERYVREWLCAQAAAGYIDYDRESQRFSMNPEQIAVFVDEDSPAYMIGGFYAISSMYLDEGLLGEAFRSGKGVGWGEHSAPLFCGTAKFFRPSYRSNLLTQWIPALEGVKAKLERGAKVADVGCGYGVSTLLLAQEFPSSTFIGFDIHEPSINKARETAREAGVTNVSFEVAAAKTFPGTDYDLVACFDCLHDMGDPAGAAAHVRKSLSTDGTWMVVEPFAHDHLHENLNPISRVYYALSTMICTPASRSQEVGLALGAQAGEGRLCEVITSGGFTQVRRAAASPFNIVLEARH